MEWRGQKVWLKEEVGHGISHLLLQMKKGNKVNAKSAETPGTCGVYSYDSGEEREPLV